MKKFTALLLALLLVFSLCACGASEDDVSGTVEPTETEAVNTPEPTEEVEEELEIGSVDNLTYKNESLGIGIDFDENWYLASEEELAEALGITADMFTEDYAEIVRNADIFYDMMAVLDENTNVNITFEKINSVYAKALSVDDYIELSIENLEPQYEAAGITLTECETVSIDFAGAEHSAVRLSCSVNGANLCQLMVVFKVANYFATLTITAPTQAVVDEVAAMFYAL